jgi:hypothetical protein
MHFWGLTIDTVSCNNLIIAIGNFFITCDLYQLFFFSYSVFSGFDGTSSTVQYRMCQSWKYPVLRILFYFVADPDPTFHCDVGPNPNPAPALHLSDANLLPLAYRSSTAPF